MGLISFLKSKFSKKDKVDQKYVNGLEKSRKNFSSRLDELSNRYKSVNQDYFDELEEILIESDVGVSLSLKIIEEVLDESKNQKITDPKIINEILVDKMFMGYANKGDIQNEIRFQENGPTVLLVIGVNGVGKTTTIAKLAYRYKQKNKKVMLAAADTFRAGAVEQIQEWGNRLEIPVIKGNANQDPASVAYEGARQAVKQGIDLLIVDTAGRLQNRETMKALYII